MATATCQLSEDQFLCSICLDVFTQPVTLPCGHNFCKNCIDGFFSNNVNYKCPYCKQVFNSRPEMKVNIFISEIAAHFRQAAQHKPSSSSEEQAAKPGEIPCDFCPGPKLKALKSCLVCLASYCNTHLEPHLNMSGLKRHQLIDPLENLEERVCPEHNKPLELFCQSDQLCVCVLCTYSDHKTHEVVPLKDASEQQKLKLRKTDAEIQEIIKMRELKIQELRCSVKLNNKNADKEITDGVKVFTALKESVERGLDNLIQDITRKKTAAKHQAEGFIKELEQEISELRKRSTEVEQLSCTDDQLHLLQTFSQLSSTPTNKDWTKVSICPSRYEGSVVRALAQLEEYFNKTTKNLFEAKLKRVQLYKDDVILDSDTAHPQLVVSKDGSEVSNSNEQTHIPDSPKRFDGLFVLGRQSFCRSFYFEALVRGKTEWTLGVAKKSVNRKGTITLNPQNGFWTVSLRNNTYYTSVDPEIRVLTKRKPETVGVFVDYKGGIVSFYDVEAAALIYSFTGFSFTEKLYPFCSPGRFLSRNSAPLIIMCVIQGYIFPSLKKSKPKKAPTQLKKSAH